jgi:CRP/FNR family cyclic AMP-dependent transcriptional regulator
MAKRTGVRSALGHFTGSAGRVHLLEAIKSQTLVASDVQLARLILTSGALQEHKAGDVLIRQGDSDNDILLIISGEVSIRVNDRQVADRSAGTHIGEMALVDPLARRSGTVVAAEPVVTMRVAEAQFSKIASRHPELWRRVAVELAKRLRERNKLLRKPHNEPVLFIGSSSEGLTVANEIYKYLVPKPLIPRLWSDGVFEASHTAIESLMNLTQEADFAALVLTADDATVSRGKKKPSPRDNVIFELGLFKGALGRERVFIIKPHGVDIRIPSDLLGVTCLEYAKGGPHSLRTRVRVPSARMVNAIRKLGPR